MKKVCLNAKFLKGPFGGGIKFAIDLKKILEEEGYKVVNNLESDDIDIIINISYFPCIYFASSFSYIDAYLYKKKRNSKVLIITRINNIPSNNIEGKELYNFIQSLYMTDVIVFISKHAQEKYVNMVGDHILEKSIVIHNGGDEQIFYSNLKSKNNDKKILKLVTHHWSDNFKKGHYIYKFIDDLLNDNNFRKKYSFRYIGNYPKNIKYNNTEIVSCLNGNLLADSLRECNIYVTAAEDEAAGMHHIEGALCGLPLLYVNSGALPEFCKDYGVEFNKNNFVEKLGFLTENYEYFKKKLENYQFKNSTQLKKYINLFESKPHKVSETIYVIYIKKFVYFLKYCFFGRLFYLTRNHRLWKNFVKR